MTIQRAFHSRKTDYRLNMMFQIFFKMTATFSWPYDFSSDVMWRDWFMFPPFCFICLDFVVTPIFTSQKLAAIPKWNDISFSGHCLIFYSWPVTEIGCSVLQVKGMNMSLKTIFYFVNHSVLFFLLFYCWANCVIHLCRLN